MMAEDIFAPKSEQKQPEQFRLGTVIGLSSGKPIVQLDGETSPSGKLYKRLASYSSPATNDRVLLVKVGGTYVILGKII